jgi:hypothetical protein
MRFSNSKNQKQRSKKKTAKLGLAVFGFGARDLQSASLSIRQAVREPKVAKVKRSFDHVLSNI